MVSDVSTGVVRIIVPDGYGSGFVIDEDGLVVTNEHVVGDNRVVTVRFDDGRSYRGSVLGVDQTADLALIDISASARFDPVQLGDSDAVRLGDDVIAMGYPLGDSLGRSVTITRGIVSSTRSYFGVDHLQTDAAINPGNSGGPLFDRAGSVVGVNTSRRVETSDGKVVQNIGFAVTVNELKDRLGTLSEGGSVARATPTALATRTPTPAPTSTSPYHNGKYGYSVDIPSDWPLDEESTTVGQTTFWLPNRRGIFSIAADELPESYSLREFAEWYRDLLKDYADADSWELLEITAFYKDLDQNREFYRLEYRAQNSNEYCIADVVDNISLSLDFPQNAIGYIVNYNACEDSSHLYDRDVDRAIASFVEWDVYRSDDYDYSVNIPPGWSIDEDTEGDDYVYFRSPDRYGSIRIEAYDLSRSYTLAELADWRKHSLEEYADEKSWDLLDITSFREERRDDGSDVYRMDYRWRTSTKYCINNRKELITLSSRFPRAAYGFRIAAGVCEHSLDEYAGIRQAILDGFEY